MKIVFVVVFFIIYIILFIYDEFCVFRFGVEYNERLGLEIMVCIGLFLIFVCVLNRQLEMSVRRNFNGDEEVVKDKRKA